MRSILAGVALVAAIVPAWGQTRISREETLHRSVQSGHELRVFTYAQWHRDCQPEQPPRIDIRTRPAHGTVAMRQDMTTVTRIREGMPDCTGKTYRGTGVFYTPAAGYHGTDQFDWNVVGDSTESHDTAIVTVK